jgi:hypothetical protein
MLFIEGNVPSLKNSKVKTARGIFSSPTVNRFIRSLGIQAFSSTKKTVKGYVDKTRPNKFEQLRAEWDEMRGDKGNPIFLGFHQVRKSKRLFDFGNSTEIIFDLLTAHDFIEDDDVSRIFPVPMTIDGKLPTEDNIRTVKWYSVDKEAPGVYLKIF